MSTVLNHFERQVEYYLFAVSKRILSLCWTIWISWELQTISSCCSMMVTSLKELSKLSWPKKSSKLLIVFKPRQLLNDGGETTSLVLRATKRYSRVQFQPRTSLLTTMKNLLSSAVGLKAMGFAATPLQATAKMERAARMDLENIVQKRGQDSTVQCE